VDAPIKISQLNQFAEAMKFIVISGMALLDTTVWWGSK
jgi:hypothetical protein